MGVHGSRFWGRCCTDRADPGPTSDGLPTNALTLSRVRASRRLRSGASAVEGRSCRIGITAHNVEIFRLLRRGQHLLCLEQTAKIDHQIGQRDVRTAILLNKGQLQCAIEGAEPGTHSSAGVGGVCARATPTQNGSAVAATARISSSLAAARCVR